ncbi:signal peptidase complex subunit 1, partial [Lecanoromycetidae sp. Uapishka_2]
MADELLQQAQELFEGQILVAFTAGFVSQNVYVTLWVGLGGAALTFFVVVPPYPFYNQSPERWLPKGSGIAGSGIEIDGKKIN